MMTPSTQTETPVAAIKTHSKLAGMATFLFFAFGIPWTGWIYASQQAASEDWVETLTFIVLPAGVSLGGFAAAFVEGGLAGLKAFARRTLVARFDLRLVALILGAPALAGLLTFVSHPDDLLNQGRPNLMILVSAFTLMNFWTGPLAEEFGWRGYLLPKLEERLPTWLAGLLIGPIWAFWHLPLFWSSLFTDVGQASGYVLWVSAWSVVLAILTKAANGNVLPAVGLHFVLNSQADFFSAFLPQLDGSALPSGITLGLGSAAVAIMVTLWWHRKMAANPPSRF